MQGLDHVIFVAPVDRQLLFRMYAIKLKKSGTKVRAQTSFCVLPVLNGETENSELLCWIYFQGAQ